MEDKNELLGIQQYRESVVKVFSRNRKTFSPHPDVFVTPTLDILRHTPIEEVFYGEKPNYSNLPKAIALVHEGGHPYFYPFVAVSDDFFSRYYPNRNLLIRSNIISGLGYHDDLIEISYGTGGHGYQAVIKCNGFEKTGFSRKNRKHLEEWLGKMVAVAEVFQSHELRETEEKHWREGQILGKGFSKIAEEKYRERRF